MMRVAALPRTDYSGNKYPAHLTSDLLGPVALTLQESIHFTNTSQESPDDEWKSLFHDVYWRLGEERRVFILSFLHQLHCLIGLQRGLQDPAHGDSGRNADHHMQHCLNYLRQTLLCTSFDALERGDFMARDFESVRMGDTLVCHDWEEIFEETVKNQADWAAWNAQWN
ncbi:hypothetical protein NM688_g3085 [Phlebia brevispora]|uniref:Uncharacterized protein n=1 Tax=Phlebia brevispora TaxID=194682 RepID=A0ACC1T6Y9_9APHY|nr:hypothetical protein NM688_g3085 [Phlebia brevispora]